MPFFRRPYLALSGESRSRGAGPENSTGDAERAPAGASRQNRPIWESCSRLTRRAVSSARPGKRRPEARRPPDRAGMPRLPGRDEIFSRPLQLDRGCRARARRGKPAESADLGKLLPANPPRRFVGPPGKASPRGAASARPGRYAAPPGAGRDFFPSPSLFLAHKDEPGRGSSRPLLRGRERVAPRPASRLPAGRASAVVGRTARGGSRAVPRRRRRGARPAGCSRPPSRGLGLRKGKGERGKGLAKKIRPKISRPQTVPHAAVVKRYAFFSPALFGPVGRISPPRRGARKLDRGCRACARRGRPAESADLGKLLPANPPRRFVGLPGEMSLRGAASARQGRYAAPPRSGTRFFPIPLLFSRAQRRARKEILGREGGAVDGLRRLSFLSGTATPTLADPNENPCSGGSRVS